MDAAFVDPVGLGEVPRGSGDQGKVPLRKTPKSALAGPAVPIRFVGASRQNAEIGEPPGNFR